MGCVNAKNGIANKSATNDDFVNVDFDARLLQESWNQVRVKHMDKASSGALKKKSARGRDANFNSGGRRGVNVNWEKLVPKLIDGLERGFSDSEDDKKSKKKRNHSKKRVGTRLENKEVLAGISALDLVVRAADDPERLDAVLDRLCHDVRKWSEDPHLAERAIKENLKAIKYAVLHLLERSLSRRKWNDKVKDTWIRFIDRCCDRILKTHEAIVAIEEQRLEQPGYWQTFSDAAKKFVKENFWSLLLIGYQLGTAILRYRNDDDVNGPTTRVAPAADGRVVNNPIHQSTHINKEQIRQTTPATDSRAVSRPVPTLSVCFDLKRNQTRNNAIKKKCNFKAVN